MRRKLSGRGEGVGPLRVAIRLPNGSRVVRRFTPDSSLTTLYALVASQLIPTHLTEEEDPATLPHGSTSESLESCIEVKLANLDLGAKGWWGFHIVNAYPREEIEWIANVGLGAVDCLNGGGQVVVELLNLDKSRPTSGERTSNGNIGGDDSDGYDTEE